MGVLDALFWNAEQLLHVFFICIDEICDSTLDILNRQPIKYHWRLQLLILHIRMFYCTCAQSFLLGYSNFGGKSGAAYSAYPRSHR